MNSQFYVDAIRKSFSSQYSKFIERENSGTCVIETALDLGRQSGKTKAAFEIIRSSRGTLNIYIGNTMEIAKGDAKKYADSSCEFLLLSKGANHTNYFRGRTISQQAVNLIFDECDMSFNKRYDIVRDIVLCMTRSTSHPYPFVHIIRLGM